MAAVVANVARAQVQQQIRGYIAENLLFVDGEIPIGDDDSFIDKGILDSTGILSLMLFVEEAFEIEVRDEEVIPENFDTVNSLASYIVGKRSFVP